MKQRSRRVVLTDVLPRCVAVAEVYADDTDTVRTEAERTPIARALTARRREFATGRACASRALSLLGHPLGPVLVGPRGEPLWPEGVTGSITHCRGYRAAAVAATEDVTSLGIDAEPDEPLPDDVLPLVADLDERAALRELERSHPGPAWGRVLFSAKESVYKAWYPLAGRWLGFEDVELTVDADQGTFRARLRVPGPPVRGVPALGFDGRWTARHGLVVTAVVVP